MKLSPYFIVTSLTAFWLLNGEPISAQEPKVEPVIIKADRNVLIRSFVDLQGGKRLTHAISVGSPLNVHYTYDADNGKLILLWKGGFLDATPMWHDRGDGSSHPLGKTIQLGDVMPEMQMLPTPQSVFKKDTIGSGFRPKGYTLDKDGRPTFKYLVYGVEIKDATKVIDNCKGIHREIEARGSSANLYLCLAKANLIEENGAGNYTVADNLYSVKLDDAELVRPFIRTIAGIKELVVPVKNKISYSILFNQ
ncbi:hypothetical protein QF042_002026 [Pedobacter sp. W3I1]|uniref:hypothetical protein n=1 Tax=Pedobacter sp. W3I1 TaxID=3042291 RepID=UPI0027836882|nr:hypothetical protein [Pedobacter sp. W3I1]MDQ0638461.1 hypothetical protein [Pedobacter sp. W3I1]